MFKICSSTVVARLSLALALCSGGLPLRHGLADDWPQWLGPQRLPIWNEDGIVDVFPEAGPPLRWKAELGGGYSGPAVADGRVFVMDRVSTDDDLQSGKLLHDDEPPSNQNFVRRLQPGRERVLCLRESDGKQLWRHEYDCPYTSVAMYAIGPRCTPTVDGDYVYTLGAEGNLVCLRVEDGSVVWKRNFVTDFGLDVPEWGVAAHPLIDGERLICMVGGAGTTCVAFNKRTGEEVWRALSATQPGYCPPVVYEFAGLRQLVVWDSDAVSALNPVTGEVYWRVPFEATFAMTIGAPQREHNSIFLMAFNRKSAMIQVSPDGRSAELAWQGNAKRGIDGVLNTAVIHDGYVYGCGNGGRFACAELKTGQRVWETFEPSTGSRPASWANVFTIRHGQRYFLANDLGDLIIANMTPSGYEELSRAHLIDPTHAVGNRTLVWSHPAFANQSVYLRNDNEIRCYSLAKSARPTAGSERPVASKLDGTAGSQVNAKQQPSFATATALVDKAVAAMEVAGAVHLVGRDGATIHAHAAGVRDIETGEPIDQNTIVRIYSMTKPITSVAAMTLYEQGKFQLDDPLSKFIPSFKQSTVWNRAERTAVAPRRPITVRDVFRHTTGYSYDGEDDPELRRRYENAGLIYRPPIEMMPPDMTIEAMAEKLASIPAHHHPGEHFTYGYSTDLLGRLIEVWSGKPLDEYVHQSVLAPLQMTDTSFNVAADKRHRFASCHTTRDGKLAVLDKSTRSPFQVGFAFHSGGGGLTSTAADYAKFCQLLVDDGNANGTQLLKRETLRLMLINQLDDVPGDFQFGLGFAIDKIEVGSESSRQTVTQYSWGGYASTEFCVIPELKVYQVFVRQHVPMKNELTKTAFDAIWTDPAMDAAAKSRDAQVRRPSQ